MPKTYSKFVYEGKGLIDKKARPPKADGLLVAIIEYSILLVGPSYSQTE
jgi:hypothetical protein